MVKMLRLVVNFDKTMSAIRSHIDNYKGEGFCLSISEVVRTNRFGGWGVEM